MPKIYLIGNAHIDPVWLWRWQEGYAEVKATFRSALDRMREFPEYIFTCSGACFYQWIEENEPDMFDEIKQRVAQGRWVLAGGWWIQPDCNLPSGESFVRHGLYSQRYFMKKFGRIATVGYNVDSFGHNAMLPQILSKSGMDSYVMMRPEAHEKSLPSNVFWWESPDGSQVLTYRIPEGYETKSDRVAIVRKMEHIKALSDEQDTPMMYYFGVGNHGGGPTIYMLKTLNELISEEEPGEICYADLKRYFADLRQKPSDFPIIQDDLQYHASGCFSALSEIKANNRKSECRLLNAEKFMTLAHNLVNLPYRAEEIEKAWRSVMFNQFHDILGGCCIREAYDDAREFHGESLKIAGDILNASVQKISWNIDTSMKTNPHPEKDISWLLWEHEKYGAPVVVFNPLSWPVHALVRINKLLRSVSDDEGNPRAIQAIRAPQTNDKDKWDTLFRAVIPALGYRVFRGRTKGEPDDIPDVGYLNASADKLENEYLRLEVSPGNGYIQIADKNTGRYVFDGFGAIPVVIDDSDTDTWAHGVYSFRKEDGRFGDARVHLIEEGPVRATIRVVSTYGHSVLQQDFSLCSGGREIEVSVKLNWQEELCILKLSFPIDVSEPESNYEIPYGYMKREPNGVENPGQSWVDVTGRVPDGTQFGLALSNTAKYSYDVLDGDLRMTVARSTVYANHFGQVDEFCDNMDIGVQYFRYVLKPHTGAWQRSDIVRKTAELLNPVISVLETYHEGPLPQRGEYINVAAENIVCTVLKMAEDGDGLILRCHETHGVKTQTRIVLPFANADFRAEFNPQEIKTFLIRGNQDIVETDLIERVF